MSRFARSLDNKKTNNHRKSRADKIELRQRVLDAIPNARVFDAFAGSGRMHRAVWKNATHYVGCDTRWYADDRLAYAADNRRVLRTIDLDPFNVFDLDAYGSPWEQALIIAARRPVAPGEKIGIIVTDGSSLKLKLGGMPQSLQAITGLVRVPAGAQRELHDLHTTALLRLARRMNCQIRQRWEARGKSGAQVIYTAILLEGAP